MKKQVRGSTGEERIAFKRHRRPVPPSLPLLSWLAVLLWRSHPPGTQRRGHSDTTSFFVRLESAYFSGFRASWCRPMLCYAFHLLRLEPLIYRLSSRFTMEPAVGVEPTTCGLQNRCSTTELCRHIREGHDHKRPRSFGKWIYNRIRRRMVHPPNAHHQLFQ